jgi:16S rRNA (guanine(966)-N(2))-methyltransferase RsmD
MRVIAGTAKGTRLSAPQGRDIRPTLDRVRTSLFDIIHNRIAGTTFLDLFAGTGANGIEALSRGAERAYFVECSKKTIPYIEANLEKTHFADKGIIIKAELPQDIFLLPTGMDIVFMDPPYNFNKWDTLLPRLEEHKIFAAESLVIIEHSRFNFPPEQFPTLKKSREEKYGDTILSFYC